MKKLLKTITEIPFEKWMQFATCAFVATALFFNDPVIVQATTGAELVTGYVDRVYEIIAALISSVGSIVLLWGFFEIGISMNGSDGTMMPTAFKRVGGGAIMTLAPQLVTAIQQVN